METENGKKNNKSIILNDEKCILCVINLLKIDKYIGPPSEDIADETHQKIDVFVTKEKMMKFFHV